MGEIKNFFLDLLFPRRCLGCNKELAGAKQEYVCAKCLSTVSFNQGFACVFCLSPTALGKTCPYCVKSHFLDRLWVVTDYDLPLIQKMLKTFKYQFVTAVSDSISVLMANYLKKKVLAKLPLNENEIIVTAVPIHWKRLNWRGFNQSELLAQKMGASFGWKTNFKILKRNQNKEPQADIKNRVARITNVLGIFSCAELELVREKIILLVDDIATTGATLNDCARTLKSAGAKEVIGFVFARGKINSEVKNC